MCPMPRPVWSGTISFGLVAIPIKRQLINREALAFPTGTATAETIRTIHDAGGSGGRVLALVIAAAIGAIAAAPSDPRVLYAGTGQVDARYDIMAGEGGLVVRIESREFHKERSWRPAPRLKSFARDAGGRF